jgi:hypothetical protein
MIFKDITVVNVKTTVFLDVTLYRLVHWYRYFGGMSFK